MPTTFDDVKVGRIFIDLNNPRHEPFTAREAPADAAILVRFVGHQGAARIGVYGDQWVQIAPLNTIDME